MKAVKTKKAKPSSYLAKPLQEKNAFFSPQKNDQEKGGVTELEQESFLEQGSFIGASGLESQEKFIAPLQEEQEPEAELNEDASAELEIENEIARLKQETEASEIVANEKSEKANIEPDAKTGKEAVPETKTDLEGETIEEEKEQEEEGKDKKKEEKQKKEKKDKKKGKKGPKRLTHIVNPAMAGGEQRLAQKNAAEKGTIDAHLTAESESFLEVGLKSINDLTINEKEKENPETKLTNVTAAVEEKPADKDAEVQALQTNQIDNAEEPEIDQKEVESDLRSGVRRVLPSTLKQAMSFSSGSAGRKVKRIVKSQTAQVESTYKKIEDTPQPEVPASSEPLNEMETPVETTFPSALSEGLIQEVTKEQTDFSAYNQEAVNMLDKEGVKKEHLELVDGSEKDLFAANLQIDEVAAKTKAAPTEIEEFKSTEKLQIEKDLQKDEGDARKAMRDKRDLELKNAKDKQKNH